MQSLIGVSDHSAMEEVESSGIKSTTYREGNDMYANLCACEVKSEVR